ncbi:alpha/beta-hydrolase [Exidia glandulosa HHB12029]|uniref:Alpha/beta-hydrolase n=1 Tax=Exidia glandulosa HHB12029 TaxID=1314781 RepID=A0A165CU74_EXIGL|nr:alpha/beta-hydrolase [Exidia glandulosa HHB12029]
MQPRLFSLAALAILGHASPTLRAPKCTDSIASLTISATNFDLSSGTPPLNATIPVSGTFDVHLRFCEPTVSVPSRAGTLQILVHGATYGADYMDAGFEPGIYSYVRYAAAHGYATLNMDRIGYGASDHPDPIGTMQTPFDVAALADIVRLARAGRISGARRSFHTIVAVGHSLGSFVLNGLVAAEPQLVNVVVLTGYSHTFADIDIPALAGFGPANLIGPARLGGLASSYLTTANASARAAAFYGPEGSFDPAALAFDESEKITVALGEFLTAATSIVASKFTGYVLTVNGEDDLLYCIEPACANLKGEAQYYPSAKSVDYGELASLTVAVIKNAGHSVNFHLAAPDLYANIHAWLSKHGY